MKSKPAVPPAPGELAQSQPVPAGFRNRPEFQLAAPVKQKRSAVLLLVSLLVLVLAIAAGFGGYRYYLAHRTKAEATNTSTQAKATDPYAGWKTYMSASEQASFRYPSDWTVTKPYMVSNDSNNTDLVGIKSPSGTITLSYVTDLVGFGDEHSASYPLNTVVDKTPIPNAPDLYVVSGTTTLDGTTYYPWIAVQDSDGIVTNGVMGNVVMFTGRRALDPTTNEVTNILFSTSGARTNENTPALTQSQATAWFATAEAEQARLILLSLNDAANQYLTIKEWNVKLPLTPAIQDAYYVVPIGVSPDEDGAPSAVWLGIRSLDASCGIVNAGGTNPHQLAAIVRALPTDRDPVSGELYTQIDPNGVTIGGYYYGLVDAGLRGNPCAPAATLQSIDAAYASAMKGIVAATTTIKVPELGIQITVPVDLRDLTYRVTTVTLRNGSKDTIAYFSTSQVAAADPSCGTNFGPFGTLGRVDGQYPSGDPYPQLDYGVLVKQFPTFYIAAGYPQAACSTNPVAQRLASEGKVEFDEAESTVQPLN